MRVGQTSFVVFTSTFLSSAIGFIATVYFARVLGPEVLGYFAITTSIVTWLVLAGDIGISNAIQKRISEGTDEEEFATAGLLTIIAFAVPVIITISLLDGKITSYVGKPVASIIILLVSVRLLHSFINATLNGERRVHITGFLSFVRTSFGSAVQIGLVVAGFALTGMFIGQAAGLAFASLVGMFYLSTGLAVPRIKHFKGLANYAKYSWIGGIIARVFNNIDILVLGIFVSPTLVGIYSVSWSVAKFLTLFSGAISGALFPEISHSQAQDDLERVSTLVTDSLTFTGLIIIPGLVGASVIGDRILAIYGSKFVQGTAVLTLLVLANLLHDYQRQLLNSLNAIDLPVKSFWINIVFISSNLFGNLILINWFGWLGAAAASVSSAAVGLGLAYRELTEQIPFESPWAEISRQAVSAISMGMFVYLLRQILESILNVKHNLTIVIVLVITGASIYFSILYLISHNFRETIRSNLFEILGLAK